MFQEHKDRLRRILTKIVQKGGSKNYAGLFNTSFYTRVSFSYFIYIFIYFNIKYVNNNYDNSHMKILLLYLQLYTNYIFQDIL